MKQAAPVVVTAIVLITFAVALWLVLTKALPQGSEQMANLMLGFLGGMAVSAVNYWVGSSSGSAAKTELLYNSVPADKK